MKSGLVSRSLYPWNCMLSRCLKSGRVEDALELYQQMQREKLKPDTYVFVSVLNACASLAALADGRRIHAQVIENGCESDVFVASSLVDMYAKCGSIVDAQRVFDRMPTRNVVSWGAMISGYVNCQRGHKALELFRQMQAEGVKTNSVIFVLVLKACAFIRSLEDGRRIHVHVIVRCLESDMFVANSLVDMYAKCGSIVDARRVFDRMPNRNVVSWGAMLAGYVNCGEGHNALELFGQMQSEGVKSDSMIFALVLKLCASIMALDEGRLVHVHVIECGCESNLFVANSLVNMYVKCGSIVDAKTVFDRMPTRNIVSWGAMLAGYVNCEEGQKALDLFQQMQVQGVKADSVILVLVLKACACTMALEEGRHVHMQVIESSCESDVFVANSLVYMYAKCGSILDAERVFHRMPVRDVVSWGTMLAGYVNCEEGFKALELFRQMQAQGVKANSVIFVLVLKACACITALEEGRCVHMLIIESGCESDVFVANGLVDMYAKCGSIADAQRVFDRMPARDVVSWSAMLGGLAMHRLGKGALHLFQEMYQAGVKMNRVTFICLLSACSHGGFVEEGIRFFESMDSVYGVSPTVEHYICVVDLLGRAGRLYEAEEFIRRQPIIRENSAAFRTLLGACKNLCNLEMGERITQKVLELESGNDVRYTLLSALR